MKKVLSIIALLSILALAVSFVYILAQPSYQTKYRLYDDICLAVEAHPNKSLDNLYVDIVNKTYEIATVEIIDVYVNDMPHDVGQEIIDISWEERGEFKINLENVDYFGNTKIEFKLNITDVFGYFYETEPIVVEINVLNIMIKNLQYLLDAIVGVISDQVTYILIYQPELLLLLGGIAGLIIVIIGVIIGVIIRSVKSYKSFKRDYDNLKNGYAELKNEYDKYLHNESKDNQKDVG